MRATSVKRTTNKTTPFDYYDTTPPAGVHTNNGVLEFDTVEYDDGTIFDLGDPTKLGPMPSDYNGKRAVFYANAIWQNDVSTYCELKIFRNGDLSEPIAVAQDTPNSANTSPVLVSRPIVLATGDYFELCARTGDSGTLLAAEDYSATFAVEVRMG